MLKDRLKELRENNHLTKKETAEKIGISERAYLTYEYGEREPKLDTLQKLADFYEVTTDYLLGREPAPNPFADLGLNEEGETEVINKYMSLPPEIRACMLDVLVQLGEAAKAKNTEASEETAS